MNYPGSKEGAGVFQAIINEIPPHDWYCEGCVGLGAIIRKKRPSIASVVIDVYPEVLETLRDHLPAGTTVIQGNVLQVLRNIVDGCVYPAGSRFVYLDPPYLKRDVDGSAIRSYQGDLYKHEFSTVEEHVQLLDLAKSLDAMVMISGYWSKLYAQHLEGWRYSSFNAVKHNGEVAREFIWMNYPDPVALHDYSYLGKDRTDRQRIKRKVQRWENKLRNMPLLERRVIQQAMRNTEK